MRTIEDGIPARVAVQVGLRAGRRRMAYIEGLERVGERVRCSEEVSRSFREDAGCYYAVFL